MKEVATIILIYSINFDRCIGIVFGDINLVISIFEMFYMVVFLSRIPVTIRDSVKPNRG